MAEHTPGFASIAHYLAMRRARPFAGLDECIHSIHTGTGFAASVSLADLDAIIAERADLLAALKALIAIDDDGGLSNDDAGYDDCVPFANEDLRSALKQARAAIAKSEGRT